MECGHEQRKNGVDRDGPRLGENARLFLTSTPIFLATLKLLATQNANVRGVPVGCTPRRRAK
jgi:hypothetical protein